MNDNTNDPINTPKSLSQTELAGFMNGLTFFLYDDSGLTDEERMNKGTEIVEQALAKEKDDEQS